jgi:hypothetical protein
VRANRQSGQSHPSLFGRYFELGMFDYNRSPGSYLHKVISLWRIRHSVCVSMCCRHSYLPIHFAGVQ